MMECHGAAMGKAVAGDPMHAFHKAAYAAHEEAANAHDQMCQECEKASESDLQKLVPTRVSAVTPTAPVTPVLRHGQRTIPLSETVDPQFAKLVAVDEGEEQWKV
jgi:hypothetical protein